MCVCVFVCVCVCLSVCMSVGTYHMCMHVCMHVYIYIYICSCLVLNFLEFHEDAYYFPLTVQGFQQLERLKPYVLQWFDVLPQWYHGPVACKPVCFSGALLDIIKPKDGPLQVNSQNSDDLPSNYPAYQSLTFGHI